MPLSDPFKAARKPAPACIGTTVCTDLVLVEGLAFGSNIMLYDKPVTQTSFSIKCRLLRSRPVSFEVLATGSMETHPPALWQSR